MKKNSTNTKKIALYGVLVAAAMILSYVESVIPPFFALPGMKLGLTNIVVVFSLYRLGSGSAMSLNIIRIVLLSLLFGGPSVMIYSLAGGMLSSVCMIALKKLSLFSVTAVSTAGGVAHNVGQILVAMLWLKTAGLGWYLLILWFTGAASGVLIGIAGSILIKRIPENLTNHSSGE